ncbi:MAG: hypothetical protein EBT13_16260 [Rhodobacteraceae bacterium]|nr:hypothetical protein [Paracoccaceae bacterium]
MHELVTYQAIRGDTIATIQAVVGKGKAKMNSAHLLGKFDHFTDEDWDSALILWWQCLAVFFFFGGAISAAVWA